MSKTVCIVQGHPDPAGGRLCHALADAYAAGAEEAGHRVVRVEVAQMDLDFVRTAAEWAAPAPAEGAVAAAQRAVGEASHLVIIYPLWLGALPALLKAFLEQLSRGGFVIEEKPNGMWAQKLKGKSARVIVTMGMPGQLYRYYFAAHSLKSLERNILRFAGVWPVRDTLIGRAGSVSPARAERLFRRLKRLGRHAR